MATYECTVIVDEDEKDRVEGLLTKFATENKIRKPSFSISEQVDDQDEPTGSWLIKSKQYGTNKDGSVKGALKHDDRLDALAIAVNYWSEKMAQDANKGITNEKQKRLDEELKNFVTGKRDSRLMGGRIQVNLSPKANKKNGRWFKLKGR